MKRSRSVGWLSFVLKINIDISVTIVLKALQLAASMPSPENILQPTTRLPKNQVSCALKLVLLDSRSLGIYYDDNVMAALNLLLKIYKFCVFSLCLHWRFFFSIYRSVFLVNFS